MEICAWAAGDEDYIRYHNLEWGRPETRPEVLYECLMLEAFQAGLSWITILRKRENFRHAFYGFRPERVANMTEDDISRLLQDEGIIRHRGKIEATIAGAKSYLEIEAREGFTNFIWKFVDFKPIDRGATSMNEVPSQTDTAKALSKALKAEGFKFVGPTITYAFMQAAGLVNDHVTSCPYYKTAQDAARTIAFPEKDSA